MGFFCCQRKEEVAEETDAHLPAVTRLSTVGLPGGNDKTAVDPILSFPSSDTRKAISPGAAAADGSLPADATKSEDAGPSGGDRDKHTGRTSQVSVVVSLGEAKIGNCWTLAHAQFKEKHAALWCGFEAVVSERCGIDLRELMDRDDTSLEKAMMGVVETKLETINKRRWKMRVPFRDEPVEARDLIQRLAGFAQATKGIWSATSSVDPIMVGLPLAGVSVIIELIGSDKAEHEAMLKGINEAGDIVYVYADFEKRLRAKRAVLGGLEERLSNALVDLYVSMLRFLAKAACHLDHNTARRAVGNAFKTNDWADDLADLREQSRRCDRLGESLQREGLPKQHESVESVLGEIKQYVEETKESLRAEYKKQDEIIKWASKVDVRATHWKVRDLMGKPSADSSGALVFEEIIRGWLISDQPVFWLVGSGELGRHDGTWRL
ncbi:hypothetical protein B0I37DRAFT_379127 [Chaetomium sp. MPI-CAGE-AT-0009]|nr:hypothetical protein B0I37DRAFT_379127 [Chaetomium sp. MPI-CAGE-AT-0009]